jgi:hypothetical protein
MNTALVRLYHDSLRAYSNEFRRRGRESWLNGNPVALSKAIHFRFFDFFGMVVMW